MGVWSAILSFVTFWVVLFTGKFPENIFKFQIGYQTGACAWWLPSRNLVDGYPAFFPKGTSDTVKLRSRGPRRSAAGW